MLSGSGLCIFMLQGPPATAGHDPGATNATEIAASAPLWRHLRHDTMMGRRWNEKAGDLGGLESQLNLAL